MESILNQFMDGISGVKILIRLALDQPEAVDPARIGWLVSRFLETSPADSEDLSADLLEVRSPASIRLAAPEAETAEETNPVLAIVGPIMGGMMIFYAFYTGASTGESILLEEERRTLQRLFTTPTSQAAILAGKFLAVFLTVLIQVSVLLSASGLIFGIHWGRFPVCDRGCAWDRLGCGFVRRLLEFDPPQQPRRRGDLWGRAHDHRDDWDRPDLRDGLAGGCQDG